MSKQTHDSKRRQAGPIPDPDSLAMDDRGTRIYRDGIYRDGAQHPGQRHVPDDGNYTGDPNKPDQTIRAEEPSDGNDTSKDSPPGTASKPS